MNYFQEYEKLKAANALITPGSIWEDACGEVKVLYTTSTDVFYTNHPTESKGYYPINEFKKDFHRVG